jgi:hypothetical protein
MRKLLDVFACSRELVNDEPAELRYQVSIRPGFQESFSAMFPAPRQRWVDAMTSREADIRALPHATLIIHGRDDRVIPLQNSLTLLEWIDRSQPHVFSRCGHRVQIADAARKSRISSQKHADRVCQAGAGRRLRLRPRVEIADRAGLHFAVAREIEASLDLTAEQLENVAATRPIEIVAAPTERELEIAERARLAFEEKPAVEGAAAMLEATLTLDLVAMSDLHAVPPSTPLIRAAGRELMDRQMLRSLGRGHTIEPDSLREGAANAARSSEGGA